MTGIFNPSYYFDSNPYHLFPAFWWIVGVVAFILVASVVVKQRSGKLSFYKREIISRLTRIGFVFSWLFLLWSFLRFNGVPVLNWRLWPVLVLVYVLIELIYLWKFAKVDYPKRLAKKPALRTADKYLKRFEGRGK